MKEIWKQLEEDTKQGRLKRNTEFKVLGYTLKHINCTLN